MAKPILLIRIDKHSTGETCNDVAKRVQKNLLDEYHVFSTVGKKDYVELEVHNAINATDIEIEELKKLVLKQIEE